MTQGLQISNGDLVLGTFADSAHPLTSAITPDTVTAGSTVRTPVLCVPQGAGSVSFEIHATPAAGSATITAKILSANRVPASGVLIDRGVTSPSGLVAFSAATAVVMAIPADTNYVQLELTVATNNVTVFVVAGVGEQALGTASVTGTVTANIGTSGALALDATLTGGTQKAIMRGGAKGATTAADVTSTAQGSDHQGLDVQIMHGGTAKDPTQIRALTAADVVTPAAPSTGYSGQFTIGTGTTAEKVNNDADSGTSRAIKSVEIRCDADSPGFLYIGFASGDLTTTGYKLYQGEATVVQIDDLAKVFVGASANSSKGSYHAA